VVRNGVGGRGAPCLLDSILLCLCRERRGRMFLSLLWGCGAYDAVVQPYDFAPSFSYDSM